MAAQQPADGERLGEVAARRIQPDRADTSVRMQQPLDAAGIAAQDFAAQRQAATAGLAQRELKRRRRPRVPDQGQDHGE